MTLGDRIREQRAQLQSAVDVIGIKDEAIDLSKQYTNEATTLATTLMQHYADLSRDTAKGYADSLRNALKTYIDNQIVPQLKAYVDSRIAKLSTDNHLTNNP